MTRRATPIAVALGALVAWLPSAQGATPRIVEASVVAIPLVLRLSAAPLLIRPGGRVQVTAALRNAGSTPVRDIRIELRYEPRGFSPTTSRTRRIDRLLGRRESVVAWTLCGRGPGSYVLLAAARGRLASGKVVSTISDARVVTVSGSSNHLASRPAGQREVPPEQPDARCGKRARDHHAADRGAA